MLSDTNDTTTLPCSSISMHEKLSREHDSEGDGHGPSLRVTPAALPVQAAGSLGAAQRSKISVPSSSSAPSSSSVPLSSALDSLPPSHPHPSPPKGDELSKIMSELPKADRLLLDRARWLVRRFESDTHGEGQRRQKECSTQGRRRGEALDYDVRPAGLDVDIIPDVSPSAERIRADTGTGTGPGPYRAPAPGPDPGPVEEAAVRMLVSFVAFLSEVSSTHILTLSCSAVPYMRCTAMCGSKRDIEELHTAL